MSEPKKPTRRTFLAASGTALACAARAASQGVLPLGLEIYSLRREMEKNIPGTLAAIRRMGFVEVEVPGLYGLTSRDFRARLDDAGLRATAMVAQEAQLRDRFPQTAADAHTLGADWVIFPWISHGAAFTREDCLKAAESFNRWGAALKAEQLKFCYHPHGYEFQSSAEGTLFDLLAERTDALLVRFQMDVFWVLWPGQDPVALLRKYPRRFPLMHLKDLARGARGNLTGRAPDEASVPVGSGVADWPAILHEARRFGVERYYIEDESAAAMEQIPRSLRYLRSIGGLGQ